MADTRKKLILNFSVIEFFFFALFGVSTYLTVYLMGAGFDSDQIGRLTSAGTLLGTLFLPFWGHLSDHAVSSTNQCTARWMGGIADCSPSYSIWPYTPLGVRWFFHMHHILKFFT